jgi:hypothetical protein
MAFLQQMETVQCASQSTCSMRCEHSTATVMCIYRHNPGTSIRANAEVQMNQLLLHSLEVADTAVVLCPT